MTSDQNEHDPIDAEWTRRYIQLMKAEERAMRHYSESAGAFFDAGFYSGLEQWLERDCNTASIRSNTIGTRRSHHERAGEGQVSGPGVRLKNPIYGSGSSLADISDPDRAAAVQIPVMLLLGAAGVMIGLSPVWPLAFVVLIIQIWVVFLFAPNV